MDAEPMVIDDDEAITNINSEFAQDIPFLQNIQVFMFLKLYSVKKSL